MIAAAPRGCRTWFIAEGYIPHDDDEKDRRFVSHETACILNAGDQDAHLRITLYFSDREPVGPYRVEVPARRTLHLRFNDLDDPVPVPRDTDYASMIESDVPVVVQHTRLDTRRESLALLSTMAYPAQ
ncbi:MAG: sensory rhodopsin transducer [Pseudomonadota bacterium]|nr:sensory rhodopsin transducer [Pseudomonadota bacterium]